MLSKTQQIIAYLVKKHHKPSVTVLIKLAYLVDLLSLKKYNTPITNYQYIRYYFGPYDKSINGDIQTLVEDQIIIPSIDYNQSGEEYVYYSYNSEFAGDLDQVTEQDKNVIDAFLEQVKGYGARTLTDIAYQTKPMKKIGAVLGQTQHLNELLDMRAQ